MRNYIKPNCGKLISVRLGDCFGEGAFKSTTETMVPSPQVYVQQTPEPSAMDPVSDNDIVISGVSGMMPNCDSFKEFSERLYNKENMVKKQKGRWELQHPELTEYGGFIRNVDKFDAQFFSVYASLAHHTEPLLRKMCEQTYQAIFDAGVNPSELSGKNIGVFSVTTTCDSSQLYHCSDDDLVGNSRAMLSNRISFYLNLKGPSVTLDGGSIGTIRSLEIAHQALTKGGCEAVIVCTGRLVLHPQAYIMHNRTVPMNSDGKTKCYDVGADGQSLSESVGVLYLQKYKDAKRVYGILKHAMTGCGASRVKPFREPEPIPRDPKMLSDFFRTFYEQVGVSPSSVEYVEGYGAALPEVDKVELQAMEQVFCKDREGPLLIGSVASNVGFTDSSSSACSIFKIILGYQTGKLAATINCKNPRQDVAALRDGRMSILTEHSSFNRTYAAVTALSHFGIHGHALLHGYRKPKDLTKYHSNIPYLVPVSGRHEAAVEKILDDIGSRPLDAEELALIHNVYKTPNSKHLSRGFGIYSTCNGETVTHSKKVEHRDDAKRPLWFVYSGMGSQWVGMAKQLMRIPVFAASIAKCHKVLEPKGLDLINILTSEDKDILDNILHKFVSIAAFQVALTDLLATIGIVPDKILGHSAGELGCAYADGCLTVEQVMLLSYLRGYVSISHQLDYGAMAAVGMGYKQLSKICPHDIEIACHNSSNSCTISGPYERTQEFVKQLTADGIFAKEVDCSNIAYHSRYISKIGPPFLKMAQEVVLEPKLRSERWVSSSAPLERWSEPDVMYSSAEYHTHNLLNTVLFEEALRFIPAHAVLVEVAPHSLMQAILKRALPTCELVSVTRRAHPDGAQFLLEGIGNLYVAGFNPDIRSLYPRVEFPVSTSTRPLSHLIEWNHSENWKLCRYTKPIRRFCSEFRQILAVEDDEYQYLKGHRIEGTPVLPFAACLVAVWDTLAMTLGRERRQLSVQFQEVKLHCQPPLREGQLIDLTATVQRGSGYFEVFDGNVILVEGTITIKSEKNNFNHAADKDVTTYLSKDDVYKLLFERGYDYKDSFRSIYSLDPSMMHGLIEWQGNWIAFLEAVIQMHILMNKHHWISQPTAIKRLVIDIKQNLFDRSSDFLTAIYDPFQNRTRCGGVTAEHVAFKQKMPVTKQSVVLKTLKFMPFEQYENNDITTAISIVMQIIAENVDSNKITLFFVDVPSMHNYVDEIKKINQILPEVDLNVVVVKKEEFLKYKSTESKPDAVFMHDLLSEKKIFEVIYHTLPSDTFLISVGLNSNNVYPSTIYNKVSTIGTGRTRVELAKFKPTSIPSNTTAITIRSMSDVHQLRTTCELLSPKHRLLVLAPHPAPSGLKEQVKFWRKNGHKNVSMVMFDQKNSMDKEMESFPNMAFSVLYKGQWGGEYFVPTKLDPAPPKGIMSLTCTRPGDLSSLSWINVEEPSNRGVEITVHYAGLVGYDASRAQGDGFGSVEGGFGMDFSGSTASGDRVMGLMPRGSAASKVRIDPRLLWPVPAHWTMEDAATVPFAYCYALYILSRICNPEPGMSILVHGGSGALGQALIAVSLAYGLEVFATVSDVHKKHFLKKLFPELKDDHIGNSRTHTFKDMVKRGKPSDSGADIVVSCAKGGLKQTAIGSCGLFGYIIDTTQLVTGENYVLGMMSLVGGRTYRTIDFAGKLTEDNDFELKWLQLMLSEGIRKGYVRPLSRVTYAPHETSRAFRLLAASRHRGRVLLSLKESAPLILPRVSCKPTSSYVVVYEDEEFALQFADLLIRRGARKLHLHGRHTSYLTYKIQQWKEKGVQVEVSSVNLSKKAEALSLILHSSSLGSVDAIYVVATHAKQKLDVDVAILANLDKTSRKVCPDLRYFAVISEDDRVLREIVNERARDNLPSLSLKLPKLYKFNSSVTCSRVEASSVGLPTHVAVEATEQALLSGDRVVAAYAQVVTPSSILQEVAKIPGVNITNATVDRTRLEQVGVDHGRVRELCNLLQDRFSITVPPEIVAKMTIGQLKRLKKEVLDVEKEVAGFGAYIGVVDDDELRATTEMVLMPTLVHRSKMRTDELNLPQDTLCIIPGLEGHHGRFHSLCARLKQPAVVFQLGHDHLEDTLQEAAQRLANSIMKYVAPKQTFYLLGHEFGVLLVLEIAAILESYGMTGTVYMIGATPEDLRSSFNTRWQDTGEDAMQDALVKHIYYIMCNTSSLELNKQLQNCKSWSVKVETLVKALQKKVAHATEYLTGIVNGIYKRIKLLQGYDVQPYKLRSKIVLVQSKPYKATKQTLKPLTEQEPVVENLKSTLSFALNDLTCPIIINNHLNPDLLAAYNHSNQCNTALVNDYEFMRHVSFDIDQ